MAKKQSLANKFRPTTFDDEYNILWGVKIVWLYL